MGACTSRALKEPRAKRPVGGLWKSPGSHIEGQVRDGLIGVVERRLFTQTVRRNRWDDRSLQPFALNGTQECLGGAHEHPLLRVRLDGGVVEHFCSKSNMGVTRTGLVGRGCPTMGSVAETWPNSTQYLQYGSKLVRSVGHVAVCMGTLCREPL
jgi:hypothetical protein